MPSRRENRCCKRMVKVSQFLEEYNEEVSCLIDHTGFHENCYARFALISTTHQYIQEHGPIGDEVHPNTYNTLINTCCLHRTSVISLCYITMFHFILLFTLLSVRQEHLKRWCTDFLYLQGSVKQ